MLHAFKKALASWSSPPPASMESKLAGRKSCPILPHDFGCMGGILARRCKSCWLCTFSEYSTIVLDTGMVEEWLYLVVVSRCMHEIPE